VRILLQGNNLNFRGLTNGDHLLPTYLSIETIMASLTSEGRDLYTRVYYNEYFCPGDGIGRSVVQREINKYLGNDATFRPGTYKVWAIFK